MHQSYTSKEEVRYNVMNRLINCYTLDGLYFYLIFFVKNDEVNVVHTLFLQSQRVYPIQNCWRNIGLQYGIILNFGRIQEPSKIIMETDKNV